MEKLLAIGRRPKWRLSFSRTCLYSCMWVLETTKNRNLCTYFLRWNRWYLVEDQESDRVFNVYAHTAYVSVVNVKKLPCLCALSMGKLLAIGRRAKWWSSFPRTCLYSVREWWKLPKTASSVYTFHEKVAGNWSKIKMAVQLFPCMPIQRTWVCEMSNYTFNGRLTCTGKLDHRFGVRPIANYFPIESIYRQYGFWTFPILTHAL